ncbi:MAG: hypothetical protein WA421_19240 [Nitrososphaeraceae archaeon]
MNEVDNSILNLPFHVKTITFLMIAIIRNPLIFNQNQPAMAQQHQSPAPKDISFDIDIVTFSHHMASVNGIQLHYVIGGQKHGMNGVMSCQP